MEEEDNKWLFNRIVSIQINDTNLVKVSLLNKTLSEIVYPPKKAIDEILSETY